MTVTAEALRRSLEPLVPQIRGNGARLVRVRTRLSENTSSYPAHIVTAELAQGPPLRLFVKDFGSSSIPKDELAHRRDRELLVYQRLLSDASLGTPAYYGCVWDESRRRFWLILEAVEGVELRYEGFDRWVAATAWLGTLQAHFASRRRQLQTADFLLHHDAVFFWSRVERALEAAQSQSTRLARRLAQVAAVYEGVVEELSRRPRTLAHGAYRPQNLLVGIRSQPGRVCATDWERCALGATVYDFACLCYGFEKAQLEQLWDAYGEAAAAGGLEVGELSSQARWIRCVHLHRIMNWLSVARERQYARADYRSLVHLAEQTLPLVG